jgi:predicted  nucleic acid-binding Zn-ribbon protein
MTAEAVKTESPCAMMRREAKSGREDIKRRRNAISQLLSEIGHLQEQPHPDQKAIAVLRQRSESLEEQLKQEELSIDTLEQVISENC